MDDERPRRGEVWRVDLETVRGHEQGGQRPACDQIRTVSTDRLTLRLGMLQAVSLAAIEERLRILLDL